MDLVLCHNIPIIAPRESMPVLQESILAYTCATKEYFPQARLLEDAKSPRYFKCVGDFGCRLLKISSILDAIFGCFRKKNSSSAFKNLQKKITLQYSESVNQLVHTIEMGRLR